MSKLEELIKQIKLILWEAAFDGQADAERCEGKIETLIRELGKDFVLVSRRTARLAKTALIMDSGEGDNLSKLYPPAIEELKEALQASGSE